MNGSEEKHGQMHKVRSRSWYAEEKMENDWTTRQDRQENATGNRSLRVSKMSQ